MAVILLCTMVTLVICDAEGLELGKIPMKGDTNILDECADAGIDLPFSCHAGACMSCSAKVISGMEFIDQEKDGDKYIETDEDVCLTCISGVTEEAINSPEEHIIELQILM